MTFKSNRLLSTIRAHWVILSIGVAILAIIAGMILFEEYVSEVKTGGLLKGQLNDVQKKAIDVILSLLQTMMTWVIAVLGATAFLIRLNFEGSSSIRIRRLDLLMSFLIVIVSVISLYLGHLAIEKISILLTLDQFPLDNPVLRRITRYQYLTGLGAIGLFGIHIFQLAWSRLAN